MDEKELSVYEQEFINVLNEIRELFLTKNRGYNGENNPLLKCVKYLYTYNQSTQHRRIL